MASAALIPLCVLLHMRLLSLSRKSDRKQSAPEGRTLAERFSFLGCYQPSHLYRDPHLPLHFPCSRVLSYAHPNWLLSHQCLLFLCLCANPPEIIQSTHTEGTLMLAGILGVHRQATAVHSNKPSEEWKKEGIQCNWTNCLLSSVRHNDCSRPHVFVLLWNYCIGVSPPLHQSLIVHCKYIHRLVSFNLCVFFTFHKFTLIIVISVCSGVEKHIYLLRNRGSNRCTRSLNKQTSPLTFSTNLFAGRRTIHINSSFTFAVSWLFHHPLFFSYSSFVFLFVLSFSALHF